MGMSPLVQQLSEKLDRWEPEVSRKVESLVAKIMHLADAGALDDLRSRALEQEVIDLLEQPGQRPFGLCAGAFTVPDDFDAPLPEETLRGFEGR